MIPRPILKRHVRNIPNVLSIVNPELLGEDERPSRFDTWIKNIKFTKTEALDDIYGSIEKWMKGGNVRSVSPEMGYAMEEEEDEEEPKVTYWGNEFLFRDSLLDQGRETFRLTSINSPILSEGITEFREKTKIFFQETSFGVMWKIIPLSVDTFKQFGHFDGCFTPNYPDVFDTMNRIDQSKLFGTFLDITIENKMYILWTSLFLTSESAV